MPTKFKIGAAFALFLTLSLFGSLTFRVIEVEGSERVVWQSLSGVSESPGKPGISLYCGWITTPNLYYTGSDTFIMDDKTVHAKNSYMTKKEREFNQPDAPPVVISVMMDNVSKEERKNGKTSGPTNVSLSCVLQYHLDPQKVVLLHNDKTSSYRTNFIKDILMDEVRKKTTLLDARSIYQGPDRVKLQEDLELKLRENSQFQKYGVICERFVIREVEILDKEFLKNIEEEARAEQARKTAQKQEIAFQAKAKAEKARALQEQNRRLVEAETKKRERIMKAEGDKEEQILSAQAKAEQVMLAAKAKKEEIRLAAEAQKEKDRLEGEGLRSRKVAEAEGVLALGKAQAEAKRLSLAAYLGEGGRRAAQVEIAKAMGEGIEKIYWVPENMNVTAISKDFQNAIAVGLPSSTVEKATRMTSFEESPSKVETLNLHKTSVDGTTTTTTGTSSRTTTETSSTTTPPKGRSR